MRRLALLGFLGLIAAPSAIADPGYYRLPGQTGEAPVLPADLTPARMHENFQSSVKLSIRTDEHLFDCGGTVISNSGYVVTASHCLLDIKDGRIATPDNQVWIQPTIQDRARGARKFKGATATFLKLDGSVAQSLPVHQLVSYGQYGTVEFDANDTPEMGADQIAQIVAYSSDYAILKIEAPTPLICAKVSSRLLADREEVWAVAHHKIMYGHRYAQITDHPLFKVPGFDFRNLQAILGHTSLLMSDLDLIHGDSGSGQFNRQGQLVAITSRMSGDYDYASVGDTDFKKSILATTIATMKASLAALVTEDQLQQIFDCK